MTTPGTQPEIHRHLEFRGQLLLRGRANDYDMYSVHSTNLESLRLACQEILIDPVRFAAFVDDVQMTEGHLCQTNDYFLAGRGPDFHAVRSLISPAKVSRIKLQTFAQFIGRRQHCQESRPAIRDQQTEALLRQLDS